MKQTMKRLIVFLLAAVMIFSLAACKKDKQDEKKTYTVTFVSNGGTAVPEQKVEEGKPAEKPADPTKADEQFAGWYEDSALTKPYDFARLVTENITLYAGWKANVLTLVSSVSESSSFVSFKENKAEKSNKQTEFIDRAKTLVVGDDNPWIIKPSLSFVYYHADTDVIEPAPVQDWTFEIKVFVKGEDGSFSAASNEYIDKIDNAGAIDFSSAACGKEVKVEIVPTGLTDKQKSEVDKYTLTLEATVVDGYNVYEAKELGYVDNSGEDYWTAFKDANGLDKTVTPAALILQKDVAVKTSDLPAGFFYTDSEIPESDADAARTRGSMKDYSQLYRRNLKADENFAIYGNYYTLSIEGLPVVTRENGNITPEGEVISHATLFFFKGEGSGNVSISDVNLIGNAPRVENTVKAGGIIMNKAQDVNFNAYNNIAICWFISYFPERTKTDYVIDSCKCYNNFNSFIYNWGSNGLLVKKSEMIGAGGPILIQDHVDSTADNGGDTPKSIFTPDCKLESYVTGTEGWFTLVKATAVMPMIKQLDQVFNPFGRSFLKANSDQSLTYLNLICVTKSGSAQSVTAEKIKGELQVNNHTFDFGASANPYLAAMLDQTFTLGAPAFETDVAAGTNGIAFFNGTGLFGVDSQQILDPANGVYNGEYLSLYYQGMMITLGYGAAGQTYTV